MFSLIGLVTKVFKEQPASSRPDVMGDAVKQLVYPLKRHTHETMKPQKDKIIKHMIMCQAMWNRLPVLCGSLTREVAGWLPTQLFSNLNAYMRFLIFKMLSFCSDIFFFFLHLSLKLQEMLRPLSFILLFNNSLTPLSDPTVESANWSGRKFLSLKRLIGNLGDHHSAVL